MPLFEISGEKVAAVTQSNFELEKTLQRLVENNLPVFFNCTFVSTEFSTGERHAGRIDTLALSEEMNPVIIEYKKVESSDLINQSLFYLSWIQDHQGDFTVAAQKKLGHDIQIDWSGVRVICIAPGYRKYDLHAVQVMGANIELWQYRLFNNNSIYLEQVYPRAEHTAKVTRPQTREDSTTELSPGQKAAITRKTGVYTLEEHFEGKPEKIVEWSNLVREYILGLDDGIEEAPKKFYIAYKSTQNIVCMEIRKKSILLYLKIKIDDVDEKTSRVRDVSNIGHFGTGDVEFTLKKEADLDQAWRLIDVAYKKVGG